MDLSTKRTVLVTGGGSGIGLALAIRFLRDSHTVIIAGRRLEALKTAQAAHPALKILQADVSTDQGRVQLAQDVVAAYPTLDVLVNNAGIQCRVDLTDVADWTKAKKEIETNLAAPIHLSMLLAEHLKQQPSAAIINVTSGLSFLPLAHVPVYSGTKAALHSLTWSLRYQLATTNVRVVEIVPPAVNTDLQSPGLHTFGENVDVYADDVYGRLVKGEEQEIASGMAEMGAKAYREGNSAMFETLNKHFE